MSEQALIGYRAIAHFLNYPEHRVKNMMPSMRDAGIIFHRKQTLPGKLRQMWVIYTFPSLLIRYLQLVESDIMCKRASRTMSKNATLLQNATLCRETQQSKNRQRRTPIAGCLLKTHLPDGVSTA